MITYISKESNTTKIRMVSSKTKEYILSKPVNLISKNNILKIIINKNDSKGNNIDVLTIDYNSINDKLGSSNLNEYLSLALQSNYFTN